MKRKQVIFFSSIILLILALIIIRKIGEERISPGFDAASQKNPAEETAFKNPTDSHTSHNSHASINPPTPEKTPDPFADLEPSTPVLALLYGRITDKQGAPVPQTKVTIRSNYSFFIFPEVCASTLTDDNGEYMFDALPVETVQVLAEKEGHFLEHAMVSFRARFLAMEKNFVLVKGGLPLGGITLDKDGNAIPGAMVRLFIPGSLLTFIQTTDDKGAFLFNGLWKAPANLSVTASGYVAWAGSDFTIGAQDMKIVLSEEGGTKIRGVVYASDSKTPVPGSVVSVKDFYSGMPLSVVISDQNGSYDLGYLIPGKYLINASKGCRFSASGFKNMIELVEGGANEVWMDIFLPGLYDIKGSVVDVDDNSPIPGAIVHAPGGEKRKNIRITGSSFVLTDEQGRFRIPECAGYSSGEKSLILWADAAGYVDNSARIEKVTKETPPVTIKLKKGIHFHGTIFSDSGAPVNNAFWELMLISGNSRHSLFNRYTDSSGRFDEMIAADWAGEKASLYAYSPKHGVSVENLQFPESGNEFKRDVTLSPGAPVTVIVMDQEGSGIRDCEISSHSTGEIGHFNAQRFTDSEGTAFFDNLPRCSLEFSARHQARELDKSQSLDLSGVDSPQEVVFLLDEPEDIRYIIHGSVTDKEGNALSDVQVQKGYGSPFCTTDSEGKYRIENKKSQSSIYELTFSKNGYGKVTERIGNPKDVKEIEINAVLEEREPFILFGNITGNKGDIPTEAEIQLFMRKKDKDPKWGSEYKWISLKPGGAFEIEPDRDIYNEDMFYSIIAKHPIYGAGNSTEIMAEGRRRLGPFDIELSWGTLKGYVRDAKTGQAVSDVMISTREINRSNINYWDSHDIHIRTSSDENGYFDLSPISFGNADIYFYHPHYWIQKMTAPEITREHPEIEWNPVMNPKAEIKGGITKSDGTALGETNVSLYNHDFRRNTETDDIGRYSIKGIPSGTFIMSYPMERDAAKGNYRISMTREIDISEPEIRTLDVKIPACVQVSVEISQSYGISLEPLFSAEYKLIYIYKKSGYGEGREWANVLLPPGRFLLKAGYDKPPREIEISPTGENRLALE